MGSGVMTDSLRRLPLAVLVTAGAVPIVLCLVALATASPTPVARRVFGKVIAVESASVTIAETDCLTGDDATRAFEEDTGQIGGPLNPIWLRDHHTTRTYEIAPGSPKTTIVCDPTGSTTSIPVELPEIERAIEDTQRESPCTSPYFWLDLEGGQVVRLEAA